jgi:integrase
MVRWGELLALHNGSFTFFDPEGLAYREVRLRQSVEESKAGFSYKNLKNEHNRETSFHKWLQEELNELLAVEWVGPLFVRPDTGGHPSRKWFSRKWAEAMAKAGFSHRDWTIHTWRHVGACVWLFDRNTDPGAVRYAMGHFSVSYTLSRYTAARGPAVRTLTLAGATQE